MDLPSTSTSSSELQVRTRSSEESLRNINLVGKTNHQINGAKLPSKRQVLQVFFYNDR